MFFLPSSIIFFAVKCSVKRVTIHCASNLLVIVKDNCGIDACIFLGGYQYIF